MQAKVKASKLQDKIKTWDTDPVITVLDNPDVGFYRGMTHLVWGGSHSGKTSICLYVAKEALSKGMNTLYWDTEDGVKNHKKNTEHIDSLIRAKDSGDSQLFMSEEVPSPEQFLEKLDEVEDMIQKQDIEVLIIDSIILPFIDMHSKKRASKFKTVFKALNRITNQYNLMTVVTTHVSSSSKTGEGFNGVEVNRPVGGNSMLHMSDIKLYVEELGDPNSTEDDRKRLVCNIDDQKKELVELVQGSKVIVDGGEEQ